AAEAVAQADLLDDVDAITKPARVDGRLQVRRQRRGAAPVAADRPFADDDRELRRFALGRIAHGAAPTNFGGAVSPRARCRCARSPGEVRGSAETKSKSSRSPAPP